MSAAFDTRSAAHDLEAAGFERRQAEAVAKAVNHGDERADPPVHGRDGRQAGPRTHAWRRPACPWT